MDDALQLNWDQFDTQFPSRAEYDARAEGSGIDWSQYPDHETVEDGEYQVATLTITPPMKNNFPDPRAKNPKPIRYIYFVVVDADDPNDVGKVIRKKVTDSGHPLSSAYPFLEAAHGGRIPPEVAPRFSDLRDKQFKITLAEKYGNSGNAYQAWVLVRPVKPENYKQAPPF